MQRSARFAARFFSPLRSLRMGLLALAYAGTSLVPQEPGLIGAAGSSSQG